MPGLHFAVIILQFYCQICLLTKLGIIFLAGARMITVLHVLTVVDDGGSQMTGAISAHYVKYPENKIVLDS